MSWIIRILFSIAAFVTAFFVQRDALNFGVMQMLVAVMLITVLIGAVALLSMRRR
jgi:hypothetical protein